MAWSVTFTATSPAFSFAIEPSAFLNSPPLRPSHRARQISARVASISVAMSASMKAIAWFSINARPNCLRSFAYWSANSKAARAMPRAWAPTIGRESSNVFNATDDRWCVPSRARASLASSFSIPPSTFSSGMVQSSSSTSAVCEARMPIFLSFLPWRMPFVPGGTTKLAWPRVPSSGSTAATTTWTSAMPPLVMKIFWPLRTQLPFLRTARVFIDETSEPASGSVTANAPTAGFSTVPKQAGIHVAICSGVPCEKMAAIGRPVPWMASAMPAQPQVSSSATRAGMMPVESAKVCCRNSTPYSPTSAAFLTTGHGNSSDSSYWCATGRISFSAKLWTQSLISRCSSVSSKETISLLDNGPVLVRTVLRHATLRRSASSCQGLLARPEWLALGQERFDPFLEVLRRVTGHDDVGVGAFRDQRIANTPQRFFGGPECEWSQGRHLVRERLRPHGQRLLVRRDLGKQATREHLLGVHEPCAHDQVLQSAKSDEDGGARVIGHGQAVAQRAGVRESISRRRRCDAKVAARGDRRPRAGASAGDRGDSGHAHRFEGAHDQVAPSLVVKRVLFCLESAELTDVGAGDKGLATGARQDDHPHCAIGVDLMAGSLETAVHVPGERVARLRPVERDPYDSAPALNDQLVGRHVHEAFTTRFSMRFLTSADP